jgi:flavin reductase (DIM6/NTAB) family NADH-FMN oxidoreductase RutF
LDIEIFDSLQFGESMDPEQKRKSLRNLTYGVYVLTAKSETAYAAATVTWVSQSSLDPPQIMVGLRRGSKTAELVKKSEKFVLNILAESQKQIASVFLKHAAVNGDTINGYPFHVGETDAPILKDALSFIECKIDEIIEGTDHDVVIARVINAGIQSEGSPLVLRSTGWSYGG